VVSYEGDDDNDKCDIYDGNDNNMAMMVVAKCVIAKYEKMCFFLTKNLR